MKKETKPTPDEVPLFNKKHSEYCGLCVKNTPCKHYTLEEMLSDESKAIGAYDTKDLLPFIEKLLSSGRQRGSEIEKEIEEIHTELHNGRMESAYKLTCALLLALKQSKDLIINDIMKKENKTITLPAEVLEKLSNILSQALKAERERTAEEVEEGFGFGTKIKLPDGTPLRIIHVDYVNEISGSVPVLVHYLETCSRIEKGTISKQDGANIKLEGWQDWLPFEIL